MITCGGDERRVEFRLVQISVEVFMSCGGGTMALAGGGHCGVVYGDYTYLAIVTVGPGGGEMPVYAADHHKCRSM